MKLALSALLVDDLGENYSAPCSACLFNRLFLYNKLNVAFSFTRMNENIITVSIIMTIELANHNILIDIMISLLKH
mgnify:FL=1